jgi:hypothetical protein
MHVGWYDFRGEGIEEIRAFWTGAVWMHWLKDKTNRLYICRNDEWRGLARRPNER